MEPSAGSKSLQCVVVTPERAVFDEPVDFVAMPMYDGELGVLPGRAALIGRLGFGELRTIKGGKTERYYIDGGFAQVRNDVVTILTSKAIKAEEINASAAEKALASAQGTVTTPESQEARLKDQERARAQMRMARRGAEETHH